ncbi:uncharacterized protein [Rutidosis leptorrhynchoides]|uniref:uncharacterized protein n=1 Tax=Rutidosis leptorrhynchoides TaxID=125765 RepID=UPI003A9A53DA
MSEADAMCLESDVMVDEVKIALWGIDIRKAQGIDGFHAALFKHHWQMLRPDLIEAILAFFRTWKLAKKFCDTMLTIIPKTTTAQGLKDYRPIALLYCHLQNYLEVDVRKAYDLVSWDFLEEFLTGLKFPRRKKSLRQGDPISPFLFMLVIELLSRMLLVPPVQFRFHKECEFLKLNHLRFADDLFLFCIGEEFLVTWFKAQLDFFYSLSGLQVSDEKTNIFFSRGHEERKQNLLCVSGFQEDAVSAPLTNWAVKHLSYTSRLILICSVLRNLHEFWCLAFRLPKSIVKIIDAKCRGFLWTGTESSSRSLVAWKMVCKPKVEALVDLFPSIYFKDANVARDSRVSQVYVEGQWQLPFPISYDIVEAWELV